MSLPVRPPVAPMLAVAASELPDGEDYRFEPKWDGFRAIAFRDGDLIELGSRNERDLARYFPEVVDALRSLERDRIVLDGEIVIAAGASLDFEALLQRIHPAASRIALLARETPASFVAFDLLALGDLDFTARPFAERRAALEEALAGEREVLLSPQTADRSTAADWFRRFEGAGFDGVVAKSAALPYRPGERVMVKVKHERTADCVVGGYRLHKDGAGVGSLLLGLYDDAGVLHHVGVASSFAAPRRRALLEELARLRLAEHDAHPWTGDGTPGQRRPGAESRWTAGRDLSFEPLRPDLVCEVAYDHLQGSRFRHAARFLRWRNDRDPRSCTYAQLDEVAPAELAELLGR